MVDEVKESFVSLGAATAALDAAKAAVIECIEARNAAMDTVLGAGGSLGDIATTSGLTPARVGQILGHPFGRVGRPPTDRPPNAR